MMKIEPTTILSRSANATFQIVAGEAILIHLNTGAYFSLNKVGTEFWEILDGATTLAQHAAQIAGRYGVETAMVTDDLIELASAMAADDLVEAA